MKILFFFNVYSEKVCLKIYNREWLQKCNITLKLMFKNIYFFSKIVYLTF